MDKERTFVIRVLTTIGLYTLWQFIVSLKLILPFPLFEGFFAVSVGYFVYLSPIYSRFSKSNIVWLLTAVFYLIKSEFYWEIVFSAETLSWFSEQIFTDVFHLLFCAFLIVSILLSETTKKWKTISLLFILGSVLLNKEYLIAFSLLFQVIPAIKNNALTKSYFLFLLLTVFIGGKWLMLLQ